MSPQSKQVATLKRILLLLFVHCLDFSFVLKIYNNVYIDLATITKVNNYRS